MITRHHIVLTILFWLIPCTAIIRDNPLVLIPVLAGAIAGTILPDIQMKRPSRLRLLTVAWFITWIGRGIFIPPVCRFYRMAGIHVSVGDKRLTHSVPGIVIFGAFCSAPSLILAIMLPGVPVSSALLAFSGGIFSGMFIHQVQDLCTRKGITLLYPFSDLQVSGSIRACDRYDPRIFRFHVQHLTAFCLLCITGLFSILPEKFLPAFGITGAASCLILMVWQSCVEIDGKILRFSPMRAGFTDTTQNMVHPGQKS